MLPPVVIIQQAGHVLDFQRLEVFHCMFLLDTRVVST